MSEELVDKLLRLVESWDRTYHYRASAIVLRDLLRDNGIEVPDANL